MAHCFRRPPKQMNNSKEVQFKLFVIWFVLQKTFILSFGKGHCSLQGHLLVSTASFSKDNEGENGQKTLNCLS